MNATTAAQEPNRHVSLDIVRGIAVMGILLLNIIAFGMPFQAYANPLAFGGDSPVDMAFWATNFVLADGKMRGLFSVLFGASMLLVVQGAQSKGENPAITHYSRMTWLLLFGAIHAYLIWAGDILMLYAIVGMVAYLFRNMAPQRLVGLGLTFILVQALLMAMLCYGIWGLANAANAPGANPADIEMWNELTAIFRPLPPDVLARDLGIYQGSYEAIVAERTGPNFWMPIKGNGMFAIETLGLMLLGMAGLKTGFLMGMWDPAMYLRIAKRAYLIGLPLATALALAIWYNEFDPVSIFLFDFTLAVLVAPYWVRTDSGSAVLARIAAAGRAAFSNYLGTSLVCTTLFYGYGFGLYGELSRAMLYIVVVAIWALMLLWSKPWLERFHYGPLEWLWRSLARRKLQPMRRQA
jgi:uncharacterized protein